MSDIKDGYKEFGCPDHGIDYRITCETCQEMYMHFSDKLRESVEDARGENILDNNLEVK